MNTTTSTARPARRSARLAAGALAVGLLLTGCLTADQQQNLDLVNAKRKANAKVTLTSDTKLVTKAQGWSDHMAKTGVLEHSGGGSRIDTGGVTGWCAIAENVGKGSSVQAVHDAFYRSSAHKANMLGNYKHLGSGVTKKGSTYWVTEVYVRYC